MFFLPAAFQIKRAADSRPLYQTWKRRLGPAERQADSETKSVNNRGVMWTRGEERQWLNRSALVKRSNNNFQLRLLLEAPVTSIYVSYYPLPRVYGRIGLAVSQCSPCNGKKKRQKRCAIKLGIQRKKKKEPALTLFAVRFLQNLTHCSEFKSCIQNHTLHRFFFPSRNQMLKLN